MMAAMSRDEMLDALSRAYQEIDGLQTKLAERDALLRDLEELGIVEGGWTELDEILLRVKSALERKP